MLVRPNANQRRQRSRRQPDTAWRDRPVAIAPHRGHGERRFGRSRWQHDHRQLAKVLYVADRETFTGRPHAIELPTKLQQQFSKGEILHSTHGYYGINAARLL